MQTIWWNIEGSMADSRPCLLGNSLGSGGTSASKILEDSTETGYLDQEVEDEESSSSEEEAGDEDDGNDADEGDRRNYVLRR